MRLAIWTAKNDFREACKSELEATLPQTAACKKILDQQPQPPPIRKRMVLTLQEHGALVPRPVVIAACCASLLLVCKALRSVRYMYECITGCYVREFELSRLKYLEMLSAGTESPTFGPNSHSSGPKDEFPTKSLTLLESDTNTVTENQESKRILQIEGASIRQAFIQSPEVGIDREKNGTVSAVQGSPVDVPTTVDEHNANTVTPDAESMVKSKEMFEGIIHNSERSVDSGSHQSDDKRWTSFITSLGTWKVLLVMSPTKSPVVTRLVIYESALALCAEYLTRGKALAYSANEAFLGLFCFAETQQHSKSCCDCNSHVIHKDFTTVSHQNILNDHNY